MALIPPAITAENRTAIKKDLNADIKLSLKVVAFLIVGIQIKAIVKANITTAVFAPILNIKNSCRMDDKIITTG